MDIKIDTAQMQELIGQAVFASLDQAKRDILIKGAIEHLVTKDQSGRYSYDRTSPIEEAFRRAVRDVAQLLRPTIRERPHCD